MAAAATGELSDRGAEGRRCARAEAEEAEEVRSGARAHGGEEGAPVAGESGDCRHEEALDEVRRTGELAAGWLRRKEVNWAPARKESSLMGGWEAGFVW